LILSLYSLCQIPLTVSDTGKTNSLVIDAKPDETQRISILVGKAGNTSALESIGPRAEDGEEDGATVDAESTDHQFCRGNRCCYQFTWLGFIQELPTDTENATCEYLRKERKYDGMACFDPIVYTTPVDDSATTEGRGPNVTTLTQLAELNNWNVFCPLTQDKSCLTLKYFSRGSGKRVVNETRWCGSLTETNSGSRIASGCYTEKVQGYFREVCSCTNSFCNHASTTFNLSKWILAVTLILSSVLHLVAN